MIRKNVLVAEDAAFYVCKMLMCLKVNIANIANSLENILAIEIEPYHSLGNNKYKKLGKSEMEQSFKMPDDQQVKEWFMQIQKHTKVIVKKRSKSIIKISINILVLQIIVSRFENFVVGDDAHIVPPRFV